VEIEETKKFMDMGLTKNQARVASLVQKGNSNAEIAIQLLIKMDTVRGHLKGIYRKLGVHGRTGFFLKIKEN
jgi:DNA-binding CsgD family transcriptional regulator